MSIQLEIVNFLVFRIEHYLHEIVIRTGKCPKYSKRIIANALAEARNFCGSLGKSVDFGSCFVRNLTGSSSAYPIIFINAFFLLYEIALSLLVLHHIGR